jgi:hypothetical protein
VSAAAEKITPRTPFLTVSRVKAYFSGVSHGTATAQRKAGERAYTSAAAEAQAEKQITTKAQAESKIARIKRAKRNARRQKAAAKKGFARGSRQQEKVIRFLNDAHKRHERYLRTNRNPLSEDEYRRAVHLSYEYFGDDVKNGTAENVICDCFIAPGL